MAHDFNQVWRMALTRMNESIMQNFPNFQSGGKILHSTLTELLVFYKRFLSLWERQGFGRTQVQPVGMQSLMVELKKYRYELNINGRSAF
jgi:hypothetical protein